MDEIAQHDEPRVTKGWLITFADLLCLLLAFFVMMSAMQKVDSARWSGIANSLSRSLDPGHAASGSLPRAERNAGVFAVRPASDLAYLEAVLADRMRSSALLAGVTIGLEHERLSIALPDPPATPVVAALAVLLDNFGNAISVRVSTPNGRIAAMERAAQLAAALNEAGYQRDVPALGLSGPRKAEIVVREGRTAP